jgi:hypothetical protein
MASILSVRDEAAWLTHISLPDRSGQGRFGQPIMKLVNGTFDDMPQLRLVFAEELPKLVIPRRNFECP